MHSTTQLLRMIQDEQFNTYTDNELCELYQTSFYQDPRILATMWLRHTGIIKNVSFKSQYQNLFTSEDISSYSLEELDHCITFFNIAKKVKFVTYFTTVFYRRLRTESQQLRCDNRKGNFNTVTLTYTHEDDNISDESTFLVKNTVNSDFNYGGIDELLINMGTDDLLQELHLSPSEISYCKLLIEGRTNVEASKILNKSVMTLSNWRKNIKKSLLSYFQKEKLNFSY